MNAVSLKLSKELHDLSGWEHTQFWYPCDAEAFSDEDGYEDYVKPFSHRADAHTCDEDTPAYSLGYLLRKLRMNVSLHHSASDNTWWVEWQSGTSKANTPEDAAAKLAIELFKQGVLKKGDK